MNEFAQSFSEPTINTTLKNIYKHENVIWLNAIVRHRLNAVAKV
jgi:hypothetical protein